VRAFFGRSPPEENRSGFLGADHGDMWGLDAATGKLVAEFENNDFGRYRCHTFGVTDRSESASGFCFKLIPTTTSLWHMARPAANALGMNRKGFQSRLEHWALKRHSASVG